MAVSVACMAIYRSTPDFQGRTFKLSVLTGWDFHFCYRSSPQRGNSKGRRPLKGSKFEAVVPGSAGPRTLTTRQQRFFDNYVQRWTNVSSESLLLHYKRTKSCFVQPILFSFLKELCYFVCFVVCFCLVLFCQC